MSELPQTSHSGSTTMRRIALIGAIANPNFGDDAILDGWLSRIDAAFGHNAIVHILTKNKVMTERMTRGHRCHVIVTDALHRLTEACGFSFPKMREAEKTLLFRHSPEAPNVRTSQGLPEGLLDEVASLFGNGVDVLHVIGGGYINSMWPDMLAEVHIAMGLAKAQGARVILTGQQMHPLENLSPVSVDDDFRLALTEVLRTADFVDFRRRPDGGLDVDGLCQAVTRTCDDLALLPFQGIRAMRRTEPYGNICMAGPLSVEGDETAVMHRRTANVVARFVRQALQGGLVSHINVLEMAPGDADTLTVALGASVDSVRVFPLYDMSMTAAVSLIANAEWNIGGKFHLAVMSLASGVPSMGWYGNKYYEDKMRGAYADWGYRLDDETPVTFGHGDTSSPEDSHVRFLPLPLVDESSLSGQELTDFVSPFSLATTREWLEQRHHSVSRAMSEKLSMVASAYGISDEERKQIHDRMFSMSYGPDSPDVSIIVPTYNSQDWISPCLDSLLSQRDCDIEVICVDDGSTDRTHVILYERSWHDERLRVVTQRNTGVSAARNKGLQTARGRYVMFCDSDDWYADDHVVCDLLSVADEHKAKVVAGLFEEHPEGLPPITSWSDCLCRYDLPHIGRIDYSEMQFDFGWVRCMYERNLLIDGRHWFRNRSYFEDPVWFASVMSDAKWLWAVDRPVYCYRTGHKDGSDFFSSPSAQQTVDLLQGLYDNVKLSSAEGYENLRSLTMNRLIRDYAPPIMELLASSGEMADKARQIIFEIGCHEYGEHGEVRLMAEMARWVGVQARNQALVEAQHPADDSEEC